MAFQTTTNEPVLNPPVTVTFSGLMVLKPGANNTCDIGVHRFNRDHLFQVILIVQKPDRPPTLTPLLTGPLTAPFSIGLSSNPAVGDFMVFAPTPDPFVRGIPNHEKDVRWAINFRDHHPNVQTNGGVEPLINLKTGVLYSSNLTSPTLAPRLTLPDLSSIPLHRIAEDLAVSIVPPAGTQVVLRWEDVGVETMLELPPLDGDPTTTYTVAFTNNPPNFSGEPHDELGLYYRVLKNGNVSFTQAMQFTLAIARGVRSDEVPCMPVLLNP